VLSATAALAYLALVVAVVGPNAAVILAQPSMIAAVAGTALALNAFGYLLGWSTKPLLTDPADRTAMLFTTSKKGVQHRGLRRVRLGPPTRGRPSRGRLRRRSDAPLTPGRQNRRKAHTV
jgi:hypothetical protein